MNDHGGGETMAANDHSSQESVAQGESGWSVAALLPVGTDIVFCPADDRQPALRIDVEGDATLENLYRHHPKKPPRQGSF
ncbi:hypothetical protein [Pseudomonas fontis]|uniref:Uncharacterized protein n=1 Tax=Pseudomonas fontis TaxID=2942633 RepID=A0ABT5NWB6_9PSED|nr:hypothetical protein [Pseudomonas fontis]MDD0975666.1 hypothetical protein [Pseudomonas fontis]MDD0992434.1 hypothetical protein [Pseudomonas fontis]